jgi:hypothetical protein
LLLVLLFYFCFFPIIFSCLFTSLLLLFALPHFC